MDERLKFIARLLDGEKMAGLCRVLGAMDEGPRARARPSAVMAAGLCLPRSGSRTPRSCHPSGMWRAWLTLGVRATHYRRRGGVARTSKSIVAA